VTHVCCHAFYGIIFIQARQGLSLPRTGAQACTRALSDTLTSYPTQKERGCEKSNKNAFSFRRRWARRARMRCSPKCLLCT
jgi:hypothetical protein